MLHDANIAPSAFCTIIFMYELKLTMQSMKKENSGKKLFDACEFIKSHERYTSFTEGASVWKKTLPHTK